MAKARQTKYEDEPLHPASAEQLRQLVKLHGAARVTAAVREIERQAAAEAGDSAVRVQPGGGKVDDRLQSADRLG